MNTYSFATAEGLAKYVDDNDFTFTGTWTALGTYFSSPYQAVAYGATLYMCVTTNTGQIPTQENPTRYWSPLVLLYENTVVTPDSSALGQAAFNLACIGTNTGTAAYLLAQTGSNLAWESYTLAQNGTQIAQTALNTASEAYELAVIGTNAVSDETGSRIAVDGWLQSQIGTVADSVAAMQVQLSVGLNGTHVVYVAGSYDGPTILGLVIVNGIVYNIWEYH